MADSPIRFGILGCSFIARKFSRAISLASPDAVLHAIASRSIDKARTFAVTNGFPSDAKIYGSYEELLDDPAIDAVYISLPSALHLKWALLAAQRNKHLLLEKPVALNVAEFDQIIEACEGNGVQFMDGTMWMHHPRTKKMEEFLRDDHKFGRLKNVETIFSFAAPKEFLENDIRVKPDLDALGALGDAGWYCIRALLWATNYQPPKTVTALRGTVTNEAGVILSCGASLQWEDGTIGTFHCSFLSHLTMDITVIGTKGTLHVNDFIIPQEEGVGSFSTASEAAFNGLHTGWSRMPSEHVVMTDIPQEVGMVKELSSLIRGINEKGLKPEKKWPVMSRKTQVVIDAVVASIGKGYEPVDVVC